MKNKLIKYPLPDIQATAWTVMGWIENNMQVKKDSLIGRKEIRKLKRSITLAQCKNTEKKWFL